MKKRRKVSLGGSKDFAYVLFMKNAHCKCLVECGAVHLELRNWRQTLKNLKIKIF